MPDRIWKERMRIRTSGGACCGAVNAGGAFVPGNPAVVLRRPPARRPGMTAVDSDTRPAACCAAKGEGYVEHQRIPAPGTRLTPCSDLMLTEYAHPID